MTKNRLETLERQLLNAQGRIEQAERLAGLGFWEWDIVEDRLTDCSESYARLFDMTRAEAMAASRSTHMDHAFVHPDDLQRYIELEDMALERGIGTDIEYRVITAKGRVRHFHEIAEVVKNDAGEVIRTSGIVQDVTDAKLAQEELAKTLADARRAERMAKLGTYTWKWPEGKIIACSEEYARLQEMTVEQVLGRFTTVEADHEAIHPDDRAAFAAIEAEALANGEGYTAEYRLQLPSGGVRHMREVCEVETNSQGDVVRSMGAIQDITEQVYLQEQLRHSLKMDALGQLTGGVAHDFNNMLTVIMGNIEFVMDSLGREHPKTKLLAEARKSAQRCADLTQRLLTFARKQSLQIETVDLQELVEGMSELLHRTLGETIQVEIQETGRQWLTETDSSQLENVILNLAINARDAMPDGGKLRIELDSVLLDEDYTSAHENLTSGHYIQLSVIDAGVGMSNEVRMQAFDPFFTTKEVDKGTGLGLSMVHGFMKQCHGHVSLYSEPGEGTVVKLFLPFSSTGTIETQIEHTAKQLRGNGEQILVVEDNADVRKLAVRMLNRLGYQTVEAENGEDALRLLDADPSIVLLFSDVVLPGAMSGVELAEKARLGYPNLNVLFTSGFTREVITPDFELLEKPYNKSKLASMISQALGAAAST